MYSCVLGHSNLFQIQIRISMQICFQLQIVMVAIII